MALPRRLWDSNVILHYLAGKPVARPDCDLIIEDAERGQAEIVFSALAEAEVVLLESAAEDAELMIREFFSRSYVVRAALDLLVAQEARSLVRRHRGLKPKDAIHIATALRYAVPLMETYDEELWKISDKEGDPPLVIRKPTYEGPRRLV